MQAVRAFCFVALPASLAAMIIASSVPAAPLDPNAFASLGTLDVSAGTLTINTDTLAISGAASFTGVVHVQGAGLPDIAVFTFDDLTIASGVTLTFQGSRPIAILSKSDAIIEALINVRGANGITGGTSGGFGGNGKLGGGHGGGVNHAATGTGRGGVSDSGGGGGFGGAGGRGGYNVTSVHPGPGGIAYGNLLNALEGGSGGGQRTASSFNGGGGAGGSAIEIGAVGALTLGQGIDARGGTGGQGNGLDTLSGGGGSGGGIIVHGATIVNGGVLNARGGLGRSFGFPGGGGGGGRIVLAPGIFTLGTEAGFNIDVAGNEGGVSSGSVEVDASPGNPGTVSFAPVLAVIPAGQFIVVGGDGSAVLSPGTTLAPSKRRVEAGGFILASAAITSGHDLDLQGGYVSANLGWTMTGAAQISGFGQLSGAVTGGATNLVAASGGALTLGDANNNTGFSFAGTIDIASGATLNLLDADAGELGAATTLADGARLNSLNGVQLDAGEIVTASAAAEIGGKFTNQGTVNGPTAVGEFLTFTDDVDGAGSYTGNVLFSDGFSPGNSPAAVSMQNATFDSTAELRLEIGGLAAGTEHDQLNVSGTADLSGTLQVVLIDDFEPTAGDAFDLMTWGTRVGTFNTVLLPPLGSGLSWNTSQLYTAGVLSVALPGDYNFDGTVDAADYVVWRKTIGTPDAYDTWRAHFGQTTPAGSASSSAGDSPSQAAVPEPASAFLLLVSVTGLLGCQSRLFNLSCRSAAMAACL